MIGIWLVLLIIVWLLFQPRVQDALVEKYRFLLFRIMGLLPAQNEKRSAIEEYRSILNRAEKVHALDVSEELVQQLLNEATPTAENRPATAGIEISVSSGAYLTDHRAIFLMAGIANSTNQSDQVVGWKLGFEALDIELEVNQQPGTLIGDVPWLWRSPLVELPPNEMVQGSLYFRGAGALAEDLPEEPLHGTVTAETLCAARLTQNVQIFRLATLESRSKAAGSD